MKAIEGYSKQKRIWSPQSPDLYLPEMGDLWWAAAQHDRKAANLVFRNSFKMSEKTIPHNKDVFIRRWRCIKQRLTDLAELSLFLMFFDGCVFCNASGMMLPAFMLLITSYWDKLACLFSVKKTIKIKYPS